MGFRFSPGCPCCGCTTIQLNPYTVYRSNWLPQKIQYLHVSAGTFLLPANPTSEQLPYFTVTDLDNREYRLFWASDWPNGGTPLLLSSQPIAGGWGFRRDYSGAPEHPDRKLAVGVKSGDPVVSRIPGLEQAVIHYLRIEDNVEPVNVAGAAKTVAVEWIYNSASGTWSGSATVDGDNSARVSNCSIWIAAAMHATARLYPYYPVNEFTGEKGTVSMTGLVGLPGNLTDCCEASNGSLGVEAEAGAIIDGYIAAGDMRRFIDDDITCNSSSFPQPIILDREHILRWRQRSVFDLHNAPRGVCDSDFFGLSTVTPRTPRYWPMSEFGDYLSGKVGNSNSACPWVGVHQGCVPADALINYEIL